jgi:hypothetical protein
MNTYKTKTKFVKAEKFILNSDQDRENMFQEIVKGLHSLDEMERGIINALCPESEYYVIYYENGHIGWVSPDIFEEEYELS